MISNINYEWLLWGFSRVPSGDLSTDVHARIDADRLRAKHLNVVTRTIPIPWVKDRSVAVRFIATPNRLRGAWRRSAEVTFNARAVFIEAFGGNGGGPGFGFTDVRVYLDGEIVGRAWSGGCSLGFGGGIGPASAMLRDDLALRVDQSMQNVELVRLRSLGRRALRSNTRRRGFHAQAVRLPRPARNRTSATL